MDCHRQEHGEDVQEVPAGEDMKYFYNERIPGTSLTVMLWGHRKKENKMKELTDMEMGGIVNNHEKINELVREVKYLKKEFKYHIGRMYTNLKKEVTRIGNIYYDPEKNKFLELRKITDEYLEFGGYTDYFSSAKTTLGIQRRAFSVLNHLELVNDVENMGNYGIYYDGIGWRTEVAKIKYVEGRLVTYRRNTYCWNCSGFTELNIPLGITVGKYINTGSAICTICGCIMKDKK